MSYFDDASLVMIPSGYKTSKVYSVKPTDGTGDLTFTRSNDTATRVGPDGLIEKVRTNFCLYSQGFASWTIQGTPTRTTGVTDPNGGTTAATISNVSTTGNFTSGIRLDANPMTISAGGKITASVYLKGSGTIGIALERSVSGTYFFETTSVTLTSSWVRYTFSPTIAGAANGFQIYVCNFTGSTATSFDIAFVQVEQGDIATDYIATTSAAVSVGPVANVPRLDYLGSSCPRLLLEPQRTNLAQYSEQFDNAYFSKVNVAINANALISPDGSTNADKLVATATTGTHYLGVNVTSGSPAVLSVFAKAAEETVFAIGNATGSAGVVFNLSNGTITSGTGGTIENYGNGWYRCSYYRTSWSDFQYFSLRGNALSYTGNGTDGIYIYGVQFEVGAYATSYIPTLGAAVTRGADSTYEESSSALIGQTEGTLFAQFKGLTSGAVGASRFSISSGTSANWIFVGTEGNNLRGYIRANSSVLLSDTTIATTGNDKIAVAYKSGSMALYINGVQIATSSSALSFSATLDDITTGVGGSYGVDDTILFNQVIVFPTRLSNADLAALTA